MGRTKSGQQHLSGVASEIPAIEAAAEEYVTIRDTRMGWTKREVEAQSALVAAMKAHGHSVYKTIGGMTCTLLVGKEKVKVKAAEEDGNGEDGQD